MYERTVRYRMLRPVCGAGSGLPIGVKVGKRGFTPSAYHSDGIVYVKEFAFEFLTSERGVGAP